MPIYADLCIIIINDNRLYMHLCYSCKESGSWRFTTDSRIHTARFGWKIFAKSRKTHGNCLCQNEAGEHHQPRRGQGQAARRDWQIWFIPGGSVSGTAWPKHLHDMISRSTTPSTCTTVPLCIPVKECVYIYILISSFVEVNKLSIYSCNVLQKKLSG